MHLLNDEATAAHLLCDVTLKDGCLRCKAATSEICCDQCNSAELEKYRPAKVNTTTTTKQIRHSRVKPVPEDENLQVQRQKLLQALFAWRREYAPKKLSTWTISRLGYQRFMSEASIQHLVACAYNQKITNVAQFSKELGWSKEYVTEFGDSLLSLLKRYFVYPVPGPNFSVNSSTIQFPLDSTALRSNKRKAPNDQDGPKCSTPTCSSCKQQGHRSM